jgi:hypothetical protein
MIEAVIERCAGVDVGKARLAEWLEECGGTHVILENTGWYWQPAFWKTRPPRPVRELRDLTGRRRPAPPEGLAEIAAAARIEYRRFSDDEIRVLDGEIPGDRRPRPHRTAKQMRRRSEKPIASEASEVPFGVSRSWGLTSALSQPNEPAPARVEREAAGWGARRAPLRLPFPPSRPHVSLRRRFQPNPTVLATPQNERTAALEAVKRLRTAPLQPA